MNILPINSTNFGKFYIAQTDYSSVQSQYLCDISSKLRQNIGNKGSYTDRIEQFGYDICAEPSLFDDKIHLYLTKTDKNEKEQKNPLRKLTMATLGDYTTDFNPERGIITAEACKKTDTILKHFLLTLAATLAIFAVGKACTEQTQKSAVSNITKTVKTYMNTAQSSMKTFKLK